MRWSWHSPKTARAPQPGDVLQADAKGVPQWAPTTGTILPFHGIPKTPGFPHYLDGLPMSVVSQLGYVDRGVGHRGLVSVVEDFINWPTREWGPYGFRPIETLRQSDTTIAAGSANPFSFNGWDFVLSGDGNHASGLVVNLPYTSGAIYLQAAYNAAVNPPYVATMFAGSWPVAPAFRFIRDRTLWFTSRAKVTGSGGIDPTTGAHLVGAAMISWVGTINPGQSDCPTKVAASIVLDPSNGIPGIYFIKRASDTDWHFVVAGYQAGSGPLVTADIPDCVQAATGQAFATDKYYPLAFRMERSGRVTAYVDGAVAGSIAADDPAVTALLTAWDGVESNPTDETDTNAAPMLAVEATTGTGAVVQLGIDNVLMAQETGPDPD